MNWRTIGMRLAALVAAVVLSLSSGGAALAAAPYSLTESYALPEGAGGDLVVTARTLFNRSNNGSYYLTETWKVTLSTSWWTSVNSSTQTICSAGDPSGYGGASVTIVSHGYNGDGSWSCTFTTSTTPYGTLVPAQDLDFGPVFFRVLFEGGTINGGVTDIHLDDPFFEACNVTLGQCTTKTSGAGLPNPLDN